MGYACPVCEHAQADAAHLANHLAITAALGRTDHEAWLDEHAPEWGDYGPEELGEIVAEHATEVETDDHGSGHGHDHAHAPPGRPDVSVETAPRGGSRAGGGPPTEGAERALAEARELTRRRNEGGSEESAEGEDDG